MTKKSDSKRRRLSVKKQAVKTGGGGKKGQRQASIYRQEPMKRRGKRA